MFYLRLDCTLSSTLWQLRSTLVSFSQYKRQQACAGPCIHSASVKYRATFCSISLGRLSRSTPCKLQCSMVVP